MGTSSDTRLGSSRSLMVGRLLIWPWIHSMVVVTSPMGVQAPPAASSPALTTVQQQQRGR